MNLSVTGNDCVPEALVAKCIAVLGIRGSGKTNTAMVVAEELLRPPHNVPMTFIDLEDEGYTIGELYECLVVGRTEHCHLAAYPDQAAALAEMSVNRSVPVILSFLEHSQEEMFAFLEGYLRGLWRAACRLRRPYYLMVEEAHEILGQYGTNTPPGLRDIARRIALRGRKRGLGMVLVSQRSALLEKHVLTQADVMFLHQVTHPTDIRTYKDIVSLPPGQVDEFLSACEPGDALVLLNGRWQTMRIREQTSFHAGYTPALDDEAPNLQRVELRQLDEALLADVEAAMAEGAVAVQEERTLAESLAAEIASLRLRNDRLQNETTELRRRLHVATQIRFPAEIVVERLVVGRMVTPGLEDVTDLVDRDEPIPIEAARRIARGGRPRRRRRSPEGQPALIPLPAPEPEEELAMAA